MNQIGLVGLFPEIKHLQYLIMYKVFFENSIEFYFPPEIYDLILSLYVSYYQSNVFSNTQRMRMYSQIQHDYYMSNSLCSCGSLQLTVSGKPVCTHPLCVPSDKKRCYLIRKKIQQVVTHYMNFSCQCPCSEKHKIKNHFCRTCKKKGHWTHECLLTNVIKNSNVNHDYFYNKHKIYNVTILFDCSDCLYKSFYRDIEI